MRRRLFKNLVTAPCTEAVSEAPDLFEDHAMVLGDRNHRLRGERHGRNGRPAFVRAHLPAGGFVLLKCGSSWLKG